MAVSENTDEMAILLQEALSEMREQRQQNIAIMEQNHRLMERLETVEEQLNRAPQTSNATRRRKDRIVVALQTRVSYSIVIYGYKMSHTLATFIHFVDRLFFRAAFTTHTTLFNYLGT